MKYLSIISLIISLLLLSCQKKEPIKKTSPGNSKDTTVAAAVKVDSLVNIQKPKPTNDNRDSLGLRTIGKMSYKVTGINDGYWERGVYFTHPIPSDKVFRPKMIADSSGIWLYYFAADTSKIAKKEGDSRHVELPIKVYELNPKKELHLIDTFNITLDAQYSTASVIPEGLENNYINRSSDNLWIDGNNLWYYRNVLVMDSTTELTEQRQYFHYQRKSKLLPVEHRESKKGGNFQVSNSHGFNILYSRISNITAIGNISQIRIYNIESGWPTIQNEFEKDPYEYVYEKHEPFTKVKDFMPFSFHPTEDYCKPFFGQIAWSSKENSLFFDNSGICYRCIWKFDLEENVLNKIVPEHEALYPSPFSYLDIEFISYTENSNLMVAEAHGPLVDTTNYGKSIHHIQKSIPRQFQTVKEIKSDSTPRPNLYSCENEVNIVELDLVNFKFIEKTYAYDQTKNKLDSIYIQGLFSAKDTVILAISKNDSCALHHIYYQINDKDNKYIDKVVVVDKSSCMRIGDDDYAERPNSENLINQDTTTYHLYDVSDVEFDNLFLECEIDH